MKRVNIYGSDKERAERLIKIRNEISKLYENKPDWDIPGIIGLALDHLEAEFRSNYPQFFKAENGGKEVCKG